MQSKGSSVQEQPLVGIILFYFGGLEDTVPCLNGFNRFSCLNASYTQIDRVKSKYMKTQIDYKVLESKELYSGKLRGVREIVETPEGKICTYETIQHPGAVVVLPIDDDGTILCVSQYRHSVREVLLELPAGTLEQGENPEECAQRELREEIGYGARELLPLGTVYPAPGFCSEIQHLFFARGLFEASAQCDEDEDITVVRIGTSEFELAVREGGMQDAKSIALYMRARVEGYL